MKILNNLIIILILLSCQTRELQTSVKGNSTLSNSRIETFCSKEDERRGDLSSFEEGEIICKRKKLLIKNIELKIYYKNLNKNSDDPYELGYFVFEARHKNKIIHEIEFRGDDVPAWFDVSFVRIREKEYFSDINNDGKIEFAIFPFSPGSAVVGTVDIYSLDTKNLKISFKQKARYYIEADHYVLLNCMRCSKFNPEECNKCE